MITDEEIMTAVKGGDLDKAGQLYDRYSEMLFNYYVKIQNDRDQAADMMQNTFFRMINYRHTYKEGHPFKAWVFQIARNVFADYLRKEKKLRSDFVDVQNLEGKISDESGEQERESQEEILRKSLARLPREAREILVMSRYQNMKYEEIGAVMELSVSAVKVKVHRSIKKLRDHYFELEKI